MTAIEILIAARSRIADPKDWWNGSVYSPPGPVCTAQAICKGSFSHHHGSMKEALVAFIEANGISYTGLIPYWNDNHTHAEVLTGFDKAIAYLRAKRGLSDLMSSINPRETCGVNVQHSSMEA